MKRRDFLKGALLAPVVVPAIVSAKQNDELSIQDVLPNDGKIHELKIESIEGVTTHSVDGVQFDINKMARKLGENMKKTKLQITADVLNGKYS